MKSKRKVKSISKLKQEADKVFSIFIRNRDKRCFTCGVVKPVAELQCGHYVSRSFNSLRYSEINCNAQCVGCNVFKSGNMPEYSANLEAVYGEGIIQALVKEKRKLKQFARQELEAIILKYKLSTSSS